MRVLGTGAPNALISVQLENRTTLAVRESGLLTLYVSKGVTGSVVTRRLSSTLLEMSSTLMERPSALLERS